jgi:DEAD/DEAH box helicase domain-containing protein
LEAAKLLRRRAKAWHWTRRERAADLADIRGGGGSPVQIVEAGTGRLLGTVDAAPRTRPSTRARSTSTRAARTW